MTDAGLLPGASAAGLGPGASGAATEAWHCASDLTAG